MTTALPTDDTGTAAPAVGTRIDRRVMARVPKRDALVLTDAELEELPKQVLTELTAQVSGPYAVRLRGQRNAYKNLFHQARDALARRTQELADAREACKRLANELRALKGER